MEPTQHSTAARVSEANVLTRASVELLGCLLCSLLISFPYLDSDGASPLESVNDALRVKSKTPASRPLQSWMLGWWATVGFQPTWTAWTEA